MPSRFVAALAAASLLLIPSAFAQPADSGGEGLAMAAFAREASGPFALPLRGRLESGFGYRWGRLHAGIDISVLDTDRVGAALAGTVAKVGYQDRYAGYGNIVLLRHGDGFATLYAHLARIGVKVGQRVDRRELLGRAGCTGSCTGQHLHFEVRILGKPVDPMPYLKHVAGSLR
ncbi:MAG TPA: M23 family metallopeptidase [Gaiellaceae bacterium]|nr:M23 family metallopeptidase [Gaiellaceae bacterium]